MLVPALAVSVAAMLILTAVAFRRNAVAMLSLAFTVVYFVEILLYYTSRADAVDFFLLLGAKYPPDWGIFTAMYVHSLSPMHIFFNILFFFLAGMPFERKIGSARLTSIFLISGIAANVFYSLFLHLSGINSILIGASGAIFGVMGAFLVMYPDEEITFLLGPIIMPRVRVKIAMLFMIALEFLATMLWITDGVAHGAHVIGAVTGALIGRYYSSRIPTAAGGKDRLYEETFLELATDEKLKGIYERIRNEEEDAIRRAWIEKFFTEKFGEVKIEGKFAESGGRKYRIYR